MSADEAGVMLTGMRTFGAWWVIAAAGGTIGCGQGDAPPCDVWYTVDRTNAAFALSEMNVSASGECTAPECAHGSVCNGCFTSSKGSTCSFSYTGGVGSCSVNVVNPGPGYGASIVVVFGDAGSAPACQVTYVEQVGTPL